MENNHPTQWQSLCVPTLTQYGWKERNASSLLFKLLLGLEGSGHHLTHGTLHPFSNHTMTYAPKFKCGMDVRMDVRFVFLSRSFDACVFSALR